jgi:LAGLIDADG endonuclease
VRLQLLSHLFHTLEGVANLELGQYAGSLLKMVDVPSYISGYVDGEGCFTVSIAPRPTLRVGWEVRPSLSVSQNGDRSEVLLLMQAYFGAGTIRPDRSDKTLKWEVRSLSVLIAQIIRTLRFTRCFPGNKETSKPSPTYVGGWLKEITCFLAGWRKSYGGFAK